MLKQTILVWGLVALSSWATFGRDTVEYIGSIGGEMSDLEVYRKDGRTFVYIAEGCSIVVYETTDPRNIVELNRVSPDSGKIYDIALGDEFLAVAMGMFGTLIYSWDNPAELELSSTIDIESTVVQASGHAILAEGGKAGTSPGSGEHYIWAYNLHDVRHPVHIFNVYNYGYQLYLTPGYYRNHTSYSSDASIFYRYYPIAKIPNGDHGFFRVRIEDDHFDETHVDISITVTDPFTRKHNVYFCDDIVLVGNPDRLKIFDISGEPSVLLYEYVMPVGETMLMDHNTAYVKSATDFCVFDVTDENHIQFNGRIVFPYKPRVIVDHVVYSIDTNKRLALHIIDGLKSVVDWMVYEPH